MAAETNTIESDFVQVKELKMLEEKMTSSGHFFFKKENLVRWEYFKPYSYLIIINKDKIIVKDDKKVSNFNISTSKVFKEINDIMLNCIQGKILNQDKFKFAFFESSANYKVELSPLNTNLKKALAKINLYFDKQLTHVVQIEIIEDSDDRTTIRFNNTKLNILINDEEFNNK
jgi:outer membrane lipoprotein-sorting protein